MSLVAKLLSTFICDEYYFPCSLRLDMQISFVIPI